MARQIVFSSKAAKPPATYSQAVKAAGLVFVSGTGPHDLQLAQSKATRFKNKRDSASKTSLPFLRKLAVRSTRSSVRLSCWPMKMTLQA